MMSTYLRTLFNGSLVGEDEFGTKYYEERRLLFKRGAQFGQPRTKRRWAVFKKDVEASQVPAHWHGWLHGTTHDLPEEGFDGKNHAWQKEHQPNLTGTAKAYRPQGSLMKGGKTKKRYEAWTPASE